MERPKGYSSTAAPRSVIELTNRLVPLLIEGAHPALAALREQSAQARIGQVELTGSGFCVDVDVPQGVPLADPLDFAGGDAVITLVGEDIRAGCALFVRRPIGNA